MRTNAAPPTRIPFPVLLFCVFCLMTLCGSALAACTGSSPTWTSTPDQASVQACLNNSIAGDTINVSAGTAAGVTINVTKGVTLSGPSVTYTGNSFIHITANASTLTRVTGFTLTGSWPCCSGAISTSGNPTSAPVRIDHVSVTSSASSILIETSDNAPVLVDHATLTAPANSEIVHNLGNNSTSDPSPWQNDVTPGSFGSTVATAMVYLEDSSFINSNWNPYYGSAIQGYYGARTVIRHNTFVGEQIDMHGDTSGVAVGARWYEIYNNVWQNPTGITSLRYADIRASSGLVFNNTQTGPDDGNMNFVFRTEGSCNPQSTKCLWQAGLGMYPNVQPTTSNFRLSPTYAWNNQASLGLTADAPIAMGTDVIVSSNEPATLGLCQSAADVKAGCPHSQTYTPYAYPHPLQSGSDAGPGSPKGLVAAVQ